MQYYDNLIKGKLKEICYIIKKRLLSILLTSLSILSLTACSKTDEVISASNEDTKVDSAIETINTEEDTEDVDSEEDDNDEDDQTTGGTLYYDPNGIRIPIVTLDSNWDVNDGGALLREEHNDSGTKQRTIELDVVGDHTGKFTSDIQIDQWFEDEKNTNLLRSADWDGVKHEENVYNSIINTEYGRVAITLVWSEKADTIYTTIISPLVSEDGEVTEGYMQMAVVDSFAMDTDENKQTYHEMVTNMTDESCVEYLKQYVPALSKVN